MSYKSKELTQIPDMVTPDEHEWLQTRAIAEQSVSTFQDMLSRYQHPYFMVKLADDFALLGADTLALDLYRKVMWHKTAYLSVMGVTDSALNIVVDRYGSEVEEQVNVALTLSQQTSYYQKWKPTKAHTFPTNLPQLPVDAQEVKDQWDRLVPVGSKAHDAYLRKLAIETNHIESTFLLTESSTKDLIRSGFSEGVVDWLPNSLLKDPHTIKRILNDTLAACQLILEAPTLDKDSICRIHATLMKTCQFSASHYIPAGKTRSETRKTVIVSGAYNIECCPFSDVDDELQYICRMSAQWIRTWRNPFGTASWMHLVLVRCHPFEDGNGRLVRLLASLPLIQHGYPPISVTLKDRTDYYHAINKAYEGNHTFLVQCILKGMKETIAEVESLV